MDKVIERIILICLLFILLTLPVIAQTGSNSISGQWSGKFDIILPDGTVQHDTAWFDLKQRGNLIIGTAGASAENQTAITDGQISDGDIRFKVNIRAGTVLTFNLSLASDRLKGEVISDPQGAKILIDVVRLKVSERKTFRTAQNLRAAILSEDQEMFNAFNNRNLEKFKTFFSRDLEFYQDLTGLTDYRKNIETFQTNFAKVAKVRRELDAASLEIYPIKNYGAIEIGTHRFYTTEPGQKEKLTAEVKFVHVWKMKSGIWRITRVVSYGH